MSCSAVIIVFQRHLEEWGGEVTRMVLFSEMELQMTSQQTHGLNFESVWRNHIVPLAGQTLESSRGPNKILSVSDAGIRRTTSSGKEGTIHIKVFRYAVERLLKGEVVSRQDVDNAFPERVSSGVCLVLSRVPFFTYEGRPAALRFDPSLLPQVVPAGLLEQALEALRRPGSRADGKEHRKFNGPGLYAIYGAPAVWEQLGLGTPPDPRPLYVGKAEHSLVDRDVKQHFGTGSTGSSTLRRSVAALLRAHLGLKAQPRNVNNPERFANYSVDDPGDVRLTEWMLENLGLSLWLAPPGVTLSEIEDEVLQHWNPPLNGKGVKNEWRPLVSQARKSMSVEASQWRKP